MALQLPAPVRAGVRAVQVARYVWTTSRRLRVLQDSPAPTVARDLTAQLVDDTAQAGVLFVKMAQFLTARDDIIVDPATRDALSRLQDSVDSGGSQPAPQLAGYAVDPVPRASASVAVVYAATRLADRARVIVKRVRPGVRERIQEDVPLLLGVLALAKALDIAGAAGMLEIVRECVPMLNAELDLRVEAKSQTALARARLPHVRVPRVYAASPGLMVSELVESRKITDAKPNAALARRLFETYLRMVVDVGLVHVDPHPGNIGVCRDGTLVLYDFGAVVDVRAAKAHVAGLARAVVTRDVEAGVRALAGVGVIRDVAPAELRRLVPKLRAVLDAPDANAELALLPEFSSNDAARRVLRLTTPYVYLIRTLVIVQGVLAYHDPSFDLRRYLRDHEHLLEYPSPWEVASSALAGVASDVASLPRSLRTMEECMVDMSAAVHEARAGSSSVGPLLAANAAFLLGVLALLAAK